MSNNNLTKTTGTAISAEMAKSLLAGIAESRASSPVGGGGGKPILRLLKDGDWVYGQQNEPVQDGSEWAINPVSILHGWICWSKYPGNDKNKILGEVLAPITSKKPPQPEPIQNFEFGPIYVFDLHCVRGDDEGVDVVYNATSLGGRQAADGFLAELTKQIRKDPAHLVAVVQLGVDSYPHPKHGKTYVPLIEVTGWTDMDGNTTTTTPEAAVEDDDDDETTVEAAPAKATKPPLSPRPGALPRRQRPADRV